MTGLGDPDVWSPPVWASDSSVGCGEGDGATPSTWKPTTLTMGGALVLAGSVRLLSIATNLPLQGVAAFFSTGCLLLRATEHLVRAASGINEVAKR